MNVYKLLQKMKQSDRQRILLMVLSSFVILCLLLWFFVSLTGVNQFIHKEDQFSIKEPLSSPRGPNLSRYRPLRQVLFDKDMRILVDQLKQDKVNVGVSNRSNEPLLSEVVEKEEHQVESELPEVIPWFYYSPNVARVSPTSLANRYQLLSKESINDFSWYHKGDQMYLFQFNQPYTGWHNLTFEGWRYFDKGLATDKVISLQESLRLNLQRNIMEELMPNSRQRTAYLLPEGQYATNTRIVPVNYSILYKNQQSMILTSPPGTKGSALLTTTENFYDMPMEVIEEVTTFNGVWLHVYIGYDELGWIKKDSQYNDYVLTYYSERELLDTMEAVLEEEASQMDARVGASFVNNETMSQISYNNQIFFPASTQKIYVLGELYHQYKTEVLSPDTLVTLYDEDKVPGAGIIQTYPNGSQFSLDELVDLISFYSDNTAANLLIDTVGGGEVINPHIHQMGLYDTYIQGKYYQGAGSWFTTTPADAALFFAYLSNNQVNGEPWDGMLIDKFIMNGHSFLRTYIGGETLSWNKSGFGETERNDVASFVTAYGDYSLAVYTAEAYNYDLIAEQMAMLSVRIHDTFNEIRSKLWMTVE